MNEQLCIKQNALTKLDILNEFAQCIDKDINVYYGTENECQINHKNIYINDDIYDYDMSIQYILIDLGFKYFNYCTYNTFVFLHELGHIINGWIDIDYYTLAKTYLNNGGHSMYNTNKMYMLLEDEYYAWAWAYEFLIKNKQVIKRLEKELKEVEQDGRND